MIYYLSRNLTKTKEKYAHLEKLALATIQGVQRFHHYILLHKTTMIYDCNPTVYILTKQLLEEGNYSKWIVILQEFGLEFIKPKSRKSLVFSKLLCDFPHTKTENVAKDSLPNKSLFLISTLDPSYGDIIIYLRTQMFRPEMS